MVVGATSAFLELLLLIKKNARAAIRIPPTTAPITMPAIAPLDSMLLLDPEFGPGVGVGLALCVVMTGVRVSCTLMGSVDSDPMKNTKPVPKLL